MTFWFAPHSDRQCRRRWAIGNLRSAGVLGLAAVTLSLLFDNAIAGEPASGLQLARHWCASCHLVESDGIASDAAPAFAAIAQDSATTPGELRAWLAKPHPPMPDLKLTRAEEDDILAYIFSLKSK